MLSASLPPCCRYHPARVLWRFGQFAPLHAAFAQMLKAQPLEYFSRPPVRSFSLRPGDSLTAPRAALSVGFIRFVSSTNATQATGFRLLPRWDSPPTEHASLSLVALWPGNSNPVQVRLPNDSSSSTCHRAVAGGKRILWLAALSWEQ